MLRIVFSDSSSISFVKHKQLKSESHSETENNSLLSIQIGFKGTGESFCTALLSSAEANKALLLTNIAAASIIAVILLTFIDIIRPPFNNIVFMMYSLNIVKSFILFFNHKVSHLL